MPQPRSLILGRWLCLAALCLIAPATALAQTSKLTDSAPVNDKADKDKANENQIITALLEEVRLLRLALEGKNMTASRLQMAIERIKLQQETVNRLAKELEETRTKLADLKVMITRMTEYTKDMEIQIRNEMFPAKRVEMEKQLRMLKIEVEALQTLQQRQQEREVLLNMQLQTEQTKLRDLNDKLDALDDELDGLKPGNRTKK